MTPRMLGGPKLSAQGPAGVITETRQQAALRSDGQPCPRQQHSVQDLWLLWGWPACVTILIHGLAVGILALAWAPRVPAPETGPSSVSLTLMSVALPPAPSAIPAPIPAPVPLPIPVPATTPTIDPVPATEPVVDLPPPEPKIDQAAIARERHDQERLRALKEQQQHEREQRRQQELKHQQQLAREQRQQRELQHQQQLAREQQTQGELVQQQSLAAQHEQARVAIGKQTEAGQQISQYLPRSKVAPDYPRRALESGIEGDCTVQYDVKADGRVGKPTIISCDHAVFERPSLRAAAGFKYEPRRVNGQAVTVPGVRNTFRYRIESK